MLDVADVQAGDAVFGDADRSGAFFVDGTQIAHLVGQNGMAVRLTRAKISERRPQLKADPRIDLRRNGGDWVTVHFTSEDDAELVVELVAVAASAHRPTDGRAARLPPTGADLDRRRRFH